MPGIALLARASARSAARAGAAVGNGGERLQPAALDVRQERSHVEERDLHFAADHRRDRLAGAALVGHVRELDARRLHEALHVEVRVAAHADRGVVELARLLLRQRDELGDVVRRKARARHHDVRDLDQLGDAGQVARRAGW